MGNRGSLLGCRVLNTVLRNDKKDLPRMCASARKAPETLAP